MVFIKKVSNADAGDADHVGGNDWDKLDDYFNDSVDILTGEINSTLKVVGSKFAIRDVTDLTKEIISDVSAITTGTTRTITYPDSNIDLGAFPVANLTGVLADARMPNLTGDVTTVEGAVETTIGALKVTNGMLAGSIAASKLIGTDIVTVGTITTGTWQGTVIQGAETDIDVNELTDVTITAIASGELLKWNGSAFINNTLAEAGIAALADKLDVFAATTKAELETVISDVANFAEADGDVYTGVHDFGGASSFELPNSATPTVDAIGEVALDTTITDHTPLFRYFSGTEEMLVIAIPNDQLTATDGHVISYNATDNEFEMVAAGAADNLGDHTATEDLKMAGFNIANGGVIFLTEQAEADADVAGKGQIWVDLATPNKLFFTDDAGTDFRISSPTITFTDVIPCVLEVPEGTVAVPEMHALATQVSKISGFLMPTATDSTINFKFVCPEDLAATPGLVIRVMTLTLSANTTDAVNLTLNMRYTGDAENMDQAFDQTVVATNYNVSDTIESYDTHDITPTNSPTAGELVTGQLFRDISADAVGDVMIVGISAHIDRKMS